MIFASRSILRLNKNKKLENQNRKWEEVERYQKKSLRHHHRHQLFRKVRLNFVFESKLDWSLMNCETNLFDIVENLKAINFIIDSFKRSEWHLIRSDCVEKVQLRSVSNWSLCSPKSNRIKESSTRSERKIEAKRFYFFDTLATCKEKIFVSIFFGPIFPPSFFFLDHFSSFPVCETSNEWLLLLSNRFCN